MESYICSCFFVTLTGNYLLIVMGNCLLLLCYKEKVVKIKSDFAGICSEGTKGIAAANPRNL